MKSIQYFIPIILGLIVPLQALANAKLGDKLGHPLWGALFNFIVAISCISSSILFFGLEKPNFSHLSIKQSYLFFGGLVGALYIFTSLFYVPRIGGLIFFSTMIAVQLIASLVYDHYGILGKTLTITPEKILGILLLLAGTFLVSK
ncbi:MAG TPA: DMT family transporter [Oligoflexia bacterium]|nr:DMT family transporter [Oligoflexia bacterium]HMR25793.1 DMT family transporter [Oligoflexia bacterium]